MRRLPHAALIATAVAASACGARVTPAVSPGRPASSHALVPLPSSVAFDTAPPFALSASTPVFVSSSDPALMRIGEWLAGFIARPPADPPRHAAVAAGDIPRGAILLTVDSTNAESEAYALTVDAERISVRSTSLAGLFYGVQTLRQLLPPSFEFRGLRLEPEAVVSLRAVRIADRPRFGWRGAMLDVARHFLSVDEVKRFIDLLALYKMNRLHLHLADDQGWRIEIASWPRLAAYGGRTQVGGGIGGFYTKAQFAELVAYAADRFITIVPEIDMPGHTNAALASYAELNCDGVAPPLYTGIRVGFSALCVDRDVTFRFIDDVVREIAAMTPGPWFHVGGDEVKTLSPSQYAAFVGRVQTIVESHGKRMIGWDEIAAATLHPTTIVQHWRPKASPGAALAHGGQLLLSTGSRMYLDMKYDAQTPIGLTWAGMIEARDAYDWDPASIYPEVPETRIAGIEAPLWSETVTSSRDAEYLAFPRLAEVAEVAWSASGRRWAEFRERLGAQAPRWSALGVNFHRSPQVPWP